MSRSNKIDFMGQLGEEIIDTVYTETGHVVKMSPNPYDEEKDCWIDEVKTEIKTQTPLFQENAYTIPVTNNYGQLYRNQLPKAIYAEQLLFVQNPVRGNDRVIKIWKAPEVQHRNIWRFHLNRHDKRLTTLWPIEKLELVFQFENDHWFSKFKEYDVSKYTNYGRHAA